MCYHVELWKHPTSSVSPAMEIVKALTTLAALLAAVAAAAEGSAPEEAAGGDAAPAGGTADTAPARL